MNTKHLFFSVAAVALAACVQIEDIEDIVPETPAYSDIPVALVYSTVDAVETKAAQDLNVGTFASGEDVMVRISNTGANEWENFTFTTGSEGAMTPPPIRDLILLQVPKISTSWPTILHRPGLLSRLLRTRRMMPITRPAT